MSAPPHCSMIVRAPRLTRTASVSLVILDKSGSMSTKVQDVIGGFNLYLDELAKEPAVDYGFSLTLFDLWREGLFGPVSALGIVMICCFSIIVALGRRFVVQSVGAR